MTENPVNKYDLLALLAVAALCAVLYLSRK
jgi:hypothetical protein